jgi:23S rRNA pseudouridine2605 synthase
MTRSFMPRDNDRSSRPPGRRGPPSRGGGGGGFGGKGKGPGRPGGGFRKDGDAPRGRRDGAPAGKRFGDKRSEGGRPGGKPFGDKRPYAAKSFRKDGERAPARDFNRDDRPKRDFNRDDRPKRDFDRSDRPARDFKRDDRPKRDFNRDDRPKRDFGSRAEGDKRPRHDGPRDSFRKDGDRGPRKDFGGDRPRSGGFKRDESRRPSGEGRSYDRPPRRDFKDRGEGGSDRPRQDRGAGQEKSWHTRSAAPRGDFKRGERSDRGEGRSERGPSRDGEKRFDRPRGDRPFSGKPRGDRPFGNRDRDDRGGDRPRFPRSRDDRPQGDRPRGDRFKSDRPGSDRFQSDRSEGRPERPRTDRGPRTSHVWRDNPRSEEETGETGERNYERRPAFGGRGEYRERRPERDGRKREAADAAPPKEKKPGDRIAKLMARAGLCSRRDAEEWIRDGRVAVNGRVIDSPALDVMANDVVTVDGAPLPERERTRLFLYHKPRGLVTTHADPEGRPTVFESLPEGLPRLISIGRLDFNTEGLLLLTNDGGLARVLELPDTAWLRRYRVRAHGDITQDRLDELRKGIEVEGVKYGPIEATLERDQGANVWVLFAIREGKNREVRNVMEHLGLDVNRLIRVSYGPFQLGELAEGQVEEVRSRMLRDQLGERIATAAGVDFGLPVRSDGGEAHGERHESAAERPPKRVGAIADRKGRRVVVERSGNDSGDDRPSRKPPSAYKGKRDRKPRDNS